jgi:hypothetical protein
MFWLIMLKLLLKGTQNEAQFLNGTGSYYLPALACVPIIGVMIALIIIIILILYEYEY